MDDHRHRTTDRDAIPRDQRTSIIGVGNGDPEWDERYAGTEQMWNGQPNAP